MTLADGKTIAEKLRPHTIKRKGLGPADLAAPYAEDMFEAGLDAMMALHHHLHRYLEWLGKQDLKLFFEEDMALFMPWLEELYVKRRGAAAVSSPHPADGDENP